MSKIHSPLYFLLSFCTAEFLVSITINGMRGRLIILHLLICFSYLLELNIISLTSPKITLKLFYYLLFVKMELCFYLDKNRSSQTNSASPDMYHCICMCLYLKMHTNIKPYLTHIKLFISKLAK